MKRLLQINPNYQATPSQKIASALAGISNTVYEFSQAYVDVSNLSLFNRAKGTWNKSPSTAAIGFGGWSFVPKGNGTVARNASSKAHSYYDRVNPSEWSLIAVVARNVDGSSSTHIEPFGNDVNINILTLNLFLSSEGYVALGEERGPSTKKRLQVQLDAPNSTNLIAITFSATQGLKMFVNGKLVQENKTDIRPLGIDQYRFVATGTYGFGHLIVADVDMSKIQYQANLQLLHDTLIQHYAL